ncbi:MAG: CrcB family protein [Acidimicrobiia bacterium]
MLGGGVVGSAARTGIGYYLPASTGAFPAATLVVNLIGSLLIGLYLARRERAITSRWSLQFWAIGVLGSFTTFSAFSLDIVHLLVSDRLLMAVGYVTTSIVGGLLLAVVGQRAGSLIR